MVGKRGRTVMTRFRFSRWIIKIFIILLGCGLLGAGLLFLVNHYIKATVRGQLLSQDEAANLEDVDCILVLGAGVWNDNRPSAMLEDRLEEGIRLYQRGISNRLLMSGDHGRREYDEVNVMKRFAMEEGIPSSDIFMDHAGFSTYESMYRARDIFEADKIVIVTQEYHLYRALYIADRLGIEAYGVASNPRVYAGQNNRELRENLARVKDYFYCLLQPKPTYLGDSIPVSGNGDITNDE
jgi:vancomycin permeability regulator SanA